jgi:hypothetical protein
MGLVSSQDPACTCVPTVYLFRKGPGRRTASLLRKTVLTALVWLPVAGYITSIRIASGHCARSGGSVQWKHEYALERGDWSSPCRTKGQPADLASAWPVICWASAARDWMREDSGCREFWLEARTASRTPEEASSHLWIGHLCAMLYRPYQ